MQPKKLVWIGAILGSTLGGIIPTLWGADAFSLSPILWSTIGGLLGIWAGFKLSAYF